MGLKKRFTNIVPFDESAKEHSPYDDIPREQRPLLSETLRNGGIIKDFHDPTGEFDIDDFYKRALAGEFDDEQ